MFTFKYKAEIRHKIDGIPCLIGVRMFKKVSPQVAADNPYDYYGYYDISYDILDSKGLPAAWLEKKVTPNEHDEIIYHVRQEMEE